MTKSAALARILVLAVATATCDRAPSPVSPAAGSDATELLAGVAASANPPTGSFRTRPVSDFENTIRVGEDGRVEVNAARFVDPDPGDELKLEVEWGDATAREAIGCGTCRLSHEYRAGTFTLRATIHDRRLADRGEKTETFTVIVPGRPFCHSLAAGSGLFGIQACPTGATQFCDTAPIDAFNAGQALAACKACIGNCNLTTFGGTGVAVDTATGGATHRYYYGNQTPLPCPAGTVTVRAGDITGNSGCTSTGARWAP